MNKTVNDISTPGGEPFFGWMGALLTAMVVLGFGASVAVKLGGVAGLPMLYHVHGAIFVSWFLLFMAQAGWVRRANLRMHRAAGQLSLVLVVAMLVTGYLMMQAAYQIEDFTIGSNSHSASMMFPVTDLVNFSLAYGLALFHRSDAVTHKRLMLLAGVLIMDPAVARLVEALGAPFMLIPVIELGLFGALLTYDWRRLGRLHWASLFGLGLWVLAMVAKVVVAPQPLWGEVAAYLFA